MRASVLVVTLAACWSSPPASPTLPAPPAPRAVSGSGSGAVYRPARSALTHEQRCAKALSAAFDVSREELAGSGLTADVVDEIQDAFVTSCEVTAWTDEVVECIAAVGAVADWNPCQNMMSQEQRDDSIKRAFEILQKRHALPNATPPSPAPP